jgi:hypothetical protein
VWQRASVHHVRARSLPFECGNDDYLFILIVGASMMCAAASPVTAVAAADAAILAQPLTARAVCCLFAAHAWTLALAGCGDCCFLRAALERLFAALG